MTKSTMGTKLPRKLEQNMQIVGEQIKLARLRRNLSMAQVAEHATCSQLTVGRIEKGAPTVAIGIYLRVLYALQLDDDILLLAKEDAMGKALQDLSLKKRERASKKISHETTTLICRIPNYTKIINAVRMQPTLTITEKKKETSISVITTQKLSDQLTWK